MRVRNYLLRSIIPLLLGVVIGMDLPGPQERIEVQQVVGTQQSAKQENVTLKITEKYPGPVEKICHHRVLVMQIHAPDGTYMEATETEFLNSYIDEPVRSTAWITEK
jgi:hypothetical protein